MLCQLVHNNQRHLVYLNPGASEVQFSIFAQTEAANLCRYNELTLYISNTVLLQKIYQSGKNIQYNTIVNIF